MLELTCSDIKFPIKVQVLIPGDRWQSGTYTWLGIVGASSDWRGGEKARRGGGQTSSVSNKHLNSIS